jgi:uncharacterized LabA/DUF88 family protein
MAMVINRIAVYVDGFNLYFGLRSKGWRDCYWLNPFEMANRLLLPGQTLQSVKYFTARVSVRGTSTKHIRQNAFLEAIESTPCTQVIYGQYLEKQRQCRFCKAVWTDYEEKMTDVNIATQILCDAYADAFDTALVVSADSDLAPPMQALRLHFPTKRVVAVFPPDRVSKKLKQTAHGYLTLGRKLLKDSQFPDEYTKPDGYVLRRPATWH